MPLLRASQFCRPSTPTQLEVSVSILTNLPPSLLLGNKRDPSTYAFVSEEVLVALGAKNDSVAFMSQKDRDRRVAVRLCLLNSDDYLTITENLSDDNIPTIAISPTTATNLGVKWNSLDNISASFTVEALYEPLQVAERVKIRPLGRPSRTVWPSMPPDPNHPDDDEDEEAWPYPLADTLIQHDNLVSVYDSKSGAVYFYLVVIGDDENKLKPSPPGEAQVVVTNRDTSFEFDDSPLSSRYTRRLPPLQAVQSFYEMIQNRDESTRSVPALRSRSIPIILPPHPNLKQLQMALMLSPMSEPRERILHVIGSEYEHDLREVVEAAAHSIGMQCISIKGLAAFAHHCGKTIRTGGLTDQLAGLEGALQMVKDKRVEPCVLHFFDFEEELSFTDAPLREDQESRFLSKWIEALRQNWHASDNDEDFGVGIHACTVPLIILVSTKQDLKIGPLIRNFVFPSVRLDTPDRAYTRHLCSNDKILDSDEMLGLFKGRPVVEISRIHNEFRRQYSHEAPNKDDGCGDIDRLRAICKEFDVERRQKDPSHAQVANVHWEDIGGIAHVRKEIMDAIELPLKYSHLFPEGSGRSGILLYGPPGTGKTLVAKAVATECGLPFLSVKGPELLGSYVGESEENVRNIFESARKAAGRNIPIAASILFFDELDSLAPKRGGLGDGGGVMERVVATLFAELDQTDVQVTGQKYGKVFVMGATNRPDLLDPNLLRRLDRLVYLGIPKDVDDRASILSAQIRKLKLDGDPFEIAKTVVATLPPNLTGADLSTIGSGALLKAVERLCRLADAEVEASGGTITLDELLESWNPEKRIPQVTVDDLIAAGKNIVPSVTNEELQRYESLQQQFSNNKA